MASDKQQLVALLEQLTSFETLTYKSMFGEYGIYLDDKFVAAYCDNKLFIKPTEAGKLFLKNPVEAPPYPGAKNYYYIDDQQLEQAAWVADLIRKTADELPLPKKKKKK